MRSNIERQVAGVLDENFVKYGYEVDKLPFLQPAVNRTYEPDFTLPNGIFVEVKGKLDVATRKKMRLVKADNPDADIRFVFHRNNKLTKAKNSWRYSDWARREGFPCCFISPGKLVDQPKSWEDILMEWVYE